MKRVNITRLVQQGHDLDDLEDELLHDDTVPLKEREGPKPKRRSDFDRTKRSLPTRDERIER